MPVPDELYQQVKKRIPGGDAPFGMPTTGPVPDPGPSPSPSRPAPSPWDVPSGPGDLTPPSWDLPTTGPPTPPPPAPPTTPFEPTTPGTGKPVVPTGRPEIPVERPIDPGTTPTTNPKIPVPGPKRGGPYDRPTDPGTTPVTNGPIVIHPPVAPTAPAAPITPTGPVGAPTIPADGLPHPINPPGTTFGPGTDWNEANLTAYFASKGVGPQEVPYWLQKKNSPEFANDPAYFWQKLQQAQSFGGGGAAPGAPVPPGPTPPSPGGSDFQQQVRAMLLQQLQSAGQPVDVNSPEITAPLQGAQLSQDRANEQLRKDLAERGYANGTLNSGELSNGVQLSREREASGMAQLHGQLVQQAYAAKSAKLQTLMQEAVATGDAEQARTIQLYMAQLDATLRREGYGIQLGIAGQGFNQVGA